MANILLVTHWTGGDVYPFIRLGKYLKTIGHEVSILTHCVYETVAKQENIAFYPIDTQIDWDELENDLPQALEPFINRQGYEKFIRKYFGSKRILSEYEVITSLDIKDNTVLIVRACSSSAALLAAEIKGISVISLYMAPSYLNQLPIINELYNEQLIKQLNISRSKLMLPPVTNWVKWNNQVNANIALWPSWFYQSKNNKEDNIEYVGFPAYASKEYFESNYSDCITNLIKSNKEIIVISGGTSKAISKNFYNSSIKACEDLSVNVIVITKFKELLPKELPENIHLIPYLDLESILPYTSIIIHHGGIGTLSCAMQFGVPQLVMAHKVDRPFNASIAENLGIGLYLPFVKWRSSIIHDSLLRLASKEIKNSCIKYKNKFWDCNTEFEIHKRVKNAIKSISNECINIS